MTIIKFCLLHILLPGTALFLLIYYMMGDSLAGAAFIGYFAALLTASPQLFKKIKELNK